MFRRRSQNRQRDSQRSIPFPHTSLRQAAHTEIWQFRERALLASMSCT